MQEMRKHSVTMRMVASEVGVHQSTVSRALRGDPRIGAEVRKQVQAAAQQMGYRPDKRVAELMQSLRKPSQGVTECLAVIHDFRPEEAQQLETVRRYVGWMRAGAERLGFAVEVFAASAYGECWLALARVLQTRGIRGVLVCPFYRPDLSEWDFPWERFSVVAIGSCPEKPPFHRVDTDDYSIMRLILSKLTETGHERIGLCIESAFNQHTRGMLVGAYLAWQWETAPKAKLPVLRFDRSKPNASAMDRWVTRWQPDVLIPCCVQHQLRRWLGRHSFEYVRLAAQPGEWGVAADCLQRMVERSVEVLVAKIFARDQGLPPHDQTTLIGARWIEKVGLTQ